MKPDLAPLVEHLLDRYKEVGVSIKRWPWLLRWAKLFDRRSTTLPYTVRLRNTAWIETGGRWALDTTDSRLVILLAHELAHVERSRMLGWFSKIRWYAKYLLSSNTRIHEEIVAYAIGACWRAAIAQKDDVELSDCGHSLKPGGAYWLPKSTDPGKIQVRVLFQAKLRWAEISGDISHALIEWDQ